MFAEGRFALLRIVREPRADTVGSWCRFGPANQKLDGGMPRHAPARDSMKDRARGVGTGFQWRINRALSIH